MTTIDEACAILFKGHANVAKMAKEVGISTEELKRTFALYASRLPIDEDVWQGDIMISWPHSGN